MQQAPQTSPVLRGLHMRPGGAPPPTPQRSWGERLWRGTLRALPRLILTGALAYAGWWAWTTFRGFPFPDEIAGHQRIDNDETEDALGILETAGDGLAGLDWEFAAYGPGNRPVYALVALPIDEDTEAASVMTFLGARKGGSASLGAATFMCEPSFPSGSLCAWLEEDTLVVLGAEESDHRTLRPLGRELREQIET